jgi:hypothetical protein
LKPQEAAYKQFKLGYYGKRILEGKYRGGDLERAMKRTFGLGYQAGQRAEQAAFKSILDANALKLAFEELEKDDP